VRRFPNDKRFAFTVFDDTDLSTVENVAPVYHFLSELGMRTTKSVWPLPNSAGARIGGQALDDASYLAFVLGLQRSGFEIALHNVRNHDAPRKIVRQGIESFQEILGHPPRTQCNHDTNRENLYWGPARLESRLLRTVYNLATRLQYRHFYQGHVENSEYFWGDLCRANISYVRNFVFDEINLDAINPTMPYHDPSKPFVNFWFSSSDGGSIDSFCKMLSEANQDKLEEAGGVCIMYTHFAKGFVEGRSIHTGFARLMRRLSEKNGWFVPVADLLDHLRLTRASSVIGIAERIRMERRWFLSKLYKGTT
jgi:hypothetical protein